MLSSSALDAAVLPAPGRACLSPADLVGDTPVLWIGEPFTGHTSGFWAKLEGHNPGGIKDRAALHMLRCARQRGDLAPGALLVESTSRTFGLGLALACSLFGHPVTLVTDPGLEPMMVSILSAAGANIVYATAPHPAGGWQQARRDLVASIVDVIPGAWCPDQYHNPDATQGYAGLGRELLAQLGAVDVLVCAVGTGGHSAGVHEAISAQCPGVRMIGVDTTGSTIFGQPARPRLMRGLGSSIYPGNVAYQRFAEVHWVSAAEAVWAARRLAACGYATGGWSVGAVALVASWAARTSPPGTVVAAVFPDGPARYASTVFNDSWCREHQLLDRMPSAEPEVIAHPSEREVHQWTRCTRVVAPAGRS